MFRSYDLEQDQERITYDLNDDELAITDIKVDHQTATGFTTAKLDFQLLAIPEPRRYRRYLKHFFVPHRGQNLDLDLTLSQPDVYLIKKHVFFSLTGTIVVIDYQRPIERRAT